MKPVAFVESAIRNLIRGGDLVPDPFGCSGTTLIAPEKAGRQAPPFELDPNYCDVLVRRWQDYSSQKATRESDGVAFDALSGLAEIAAPTVAQWITKPVR